MDSKGRYGSFILKILTIFDFVILNLVYLFIIFNVADIGEFKNKITWLLINISYVPVIYFYSEVHTKRILFVDKVLGILFKAALVHVCSMITFMFIMGFEDIPIRVYVYFYLLLYALLGFWWISSRMILKFFRRRGLNFRRIVIVGWNGTSKRMYQEIKCDKGYGYKVIGIFDNGKYKDVKITGKLSELEQFVVKENVDEIYCSLPSEEANVAEVIKIADNHDVQFFYVPMISGFMTTTFSLSSFGNIPILVYRPNPLQSFINRFLKRVFDLVFSTIAIILVSCTILIPIIIAIKISSPGPIFFKQKRTGYRGKEFTCYKFRSMKVNADADTKQATKDDPRKTKVGDFLRKSSIDELPQFLNVFLGNMSVVGPRPHMVKQTEEYSKLIDKYMVRHMIKPGITGLAQVYGYRGQTEELWQMEKRVEYDVRYIETWSLGLDIKIIIRTIVNAFRGEKNAF